MELRWLVVARRLTVISQISHLGRVYGILLRHGSRDPIGRRLRLVRPALRHVPLARVNQGEQDVTWT